MASEDVAGRDLSRPAARGYFAALDAIDLVSRWAIIGLMATMTATVVAQVFFRYVLNDSIDAADEVSRLTFVWSILLALPHGLKTGAHVGIDLIVGRLSAALRFGVFRFTSVAAILLLAVVAWQAIRMVIRTWDQPLPTLPLSSGLFYVALLIAAIHAILHLIPFALRWAAEPGTVEESS